MLPNMNCKNVVFKEVGCKRTELCNTVNMSIRLGEDLGLVQMNVDDGTSLMTNESIMNFFLNFLPVLL